MGPRKRAATGRYHRTVVGRLWLCLFLFALGWPASGDAEARDAAVAGRRAIVPQAQPGAPPFPAELHEKLTAALALAGGEPRTRHRRENGSPLYTNRLLLESSPYLRQHAHNPVNWFPWSPEAFETAHRLGRPVLVSIGYSTCHWCHVMEEESFEDLEVAEFLNRHFVAVKVDREMRPDVDAIYMAAVQALEGRGGWPLNVFVTAEREPFYGGTYFPPRDRPGRLGFLTVLQSIQERFEQEPERVEGIAGRLAATVKSRLEGARAPLTETVALDSAPLHTAREQIGRIFDWIWGGVGHRPKFPSRPSVPLLLRHHRRTGDRESLQMASLTLEKMAAGGIHDHVGGGFHRYSTDQRWLVPHFEKMLYDNARLAVAYLEAWQLTGRAEFAAVTRDIMRYVERDMTHPEGAFYSATDADSLNPAGESEEGWFFTWTADELRAALPPDQMNAVVVRYGVTAAGNFEGRNILFTAGRLPAVAEELALRPSELASRLDRARERLYQVRAQRPAPLRDEKILVAWNGLMISAFARAGFALDEPRLTRAAARAADFLLTRVRVDGRLRRSFKDGRAEGPAFLEDYAFLIAGLIDCYEADRNPRWLREALALQDALTLEYWDAQAGGYFRTAAGHESLLAREKPGDDGALPSGNSVAVRNALRLYAFTGEPSHLERADAILGAFHGQLSRSPAAFSEMLLALDARLDVAKEVVVVRALESDDLGPMLAPLRRAFVPNRVLSVVTEGEDLATHASLVPLVKYKVARDGAVTAYVCENRVCKFPTTDPDVFARQLAKVAPLP